MEQRKILPAEFADMAQVLYDSNGTQEDIDKLITDTLISLDTAYLDGLNILWQRELDLEEEYWSNDYGRESYS